MNSDELSVVERKISWCCAVEIVNSDKLSVTARLSACQCLCLLIEVGRQATIKTVNRNVTERIRNTRW